MSWRLVRIRDFVQMYTFDTQRFATHLRRARLIPESAMGLSSSRHLSCQCAGIDLMVSSCYNSTNRLVYSMLQKAVLGWTRLTRRGIDKHRHQEHAQSR